MPVALIAAGVSAVGAIGGATIGAISSKNAAKSAANSQAQALAYQQQKDAETAKNNAPFISSGQSAIGQQADLAGANGASAQQLAINGVQAGPLYQSMYRNGQEAVLQNASATGGLRGGNTQHSLADFGADTLARAIQQQIGNLSGISTLGANAAAGQASYNSNSVAQASQAYTNQGNAAAAGAFGQGAALSNGINGVAGAFGKYFGSAGGGFAAPNFGPELTSSLGSNAYSLGGSAYQAPSIFGGS
jgi:hypothetical protein